MNNKIVSFPHLGDYYYPIKYLLQNTTNLIIKEAPKITKNTINIGSKYSPDTVCLPFKYNLGNFIESLEMGANILIQAGGGCRYGYYAELQEQILKDLGYEFDFYTLVNSEKITLKYLYNTFKKLNKRINIFKFFHYLIMTFLFIIYIDSFDHYIRKNKAFENKKNSYKNLKKEYLNKFNNCHNIITMTFNYFKYKYKLKKIKFIKPKKYIKIGIIGELFTSMEGNASLTLEDELINMGISIKRFTNVSYLVLFKRFLIKKMLRKTKGICKYTIGADGLDNVYRCLWLKKHNYDGIIHIKPFGCTPEVSAISIINKICQEKNIPIIYFSFDTQNSNESLKTRLEAFYDMLRIRKENNYE